LNIVIETPRGSREKYKYEEELHLFRLHKTLSAGLSFPFDFGFIPGTKGEDGDPLDAMVISEFKSFPGCIMDCRIIGCIKAEQSKNEKTIRNDRFLVIPEQTVVFENVLSFEDLTPTLLLDIETFLTTYMQLEGKDFLLLGKLNAAQAMSMLQEKMVSSNKTLAGHKNLL
jgi:inorganic pyrophosphatase